MNTLPQFPIWARVSIERAQCDPQFRHDGALRGLLQAYASTYGETVPADVERAAIEYCTSRIADWRAPA